MNTHFSFTRLLLTLELLSVSVRFPAGFPNPDERYRSCGNTFNCGSIAGVTYPFRGYDDPPYCGYPGLVLRCNRNNITTIEIAKMIFRVMEIDPITQTARIAREDVMETGCPRVLENTTVDPALFDYVSDYVNLTFLYDCPPISFPPVIPLPCGDGGVVYVPLGSQGPWNCARSITVPVAPTSVNRTDWGRVLGEGFDVRWKVDSRDCPQCVGSNGRCGFDVVTNRTVCFCPDPPFVSAACLTGT